MEIAFEVDPLIEFRESLSNPLTRKKYEARLDMFLKHVYPDSPDVKNRAHEFAKHAKADQAWPTFAINDFLRIQKERAERGEISKATLQNYWKPVKLFCEMNEILLNWRKITRRLPSFRAYSNDRPYTVEEIRAMLRYKDPRIKAVILTFVSSGIRVVSWDYLLWEHVKPILRNGQVVAASLKVYAGEKEEYSTFVTKEAYEALKEWMDLRSDSGERVMGKSFLMRDLWDDHVTTKGGVQQRGIVSHPKKLSSIGVTRLIQRALFAQGIRTKLEEGKSRHEFQALHGFRKYFNTVCDRRMKTLYVEILMGHDIGLKESYNREQESELLQEYLKAVPELTILEARPQEISEDVETLKDKLEAANSRIIGLEGEIKELRDGVREILELRKQELAAKKSRE